MRSNKIPGRCFPFLRIYTPSPPRLYRLYSLPQITSLACRLPGGEEEEAGAQERRSVRGLARSVPVYVASSSHSREPSL